MQARAGAFEMLASLRLAATVGVRGRPIQARRNRTQAKKLQHATVLGIPDQVAL